MATQITQIEDTVRGKTILRVEGEMQYQDAALLEKIAVNLRRSGAANVTIDLADLGLLDSEGASVLRRMQTEHNFEIEGIEHFLQAAIDDTERRGQ